MDCSRKLSLVYIISHSFCSGTLKFEIIGEIKEVPRELIEYEYIVGDSHGRILEDKVPVYPFGRDSVYKESMTGRLRTLITSGLKHSINLRPTHSEST